VELQVAHEAVEQLVQDLLDARPGRRVIEHAAEPLDGDGQVAGNAALHGGDQALRQHVLECAVRLQQADGAAVDVVA
jgi:hypothetical protein